MPRAIRDRRKVPRREGKRKALGTAASARAARQSGRRAVPRNMEPRNGSRLSKTAVRHSGRKGKADRGKGRKNSITERGCKRPIGPGGLGQSGSRGVQDQFRRREPDPSAQGQGDPRTGEPGPPGRRYARGRRRGRREESVMAHMSADPARICRPEDRPENRAARRSIPRRHSADAEQDPRNPGRPRHVMPQGREGLKGPADQPGEAADQSREPGTTRESASQQGHAQRPEDRVDGDKPGVGLVRGQEEDEEPPADRGSGSSDRQKRLTESGTGIAKGQGAFAEPRSADWTRGK